MNAPFVHRVLNLTWTSPNLPVTRGSPNTILSIFDRYMRNPPLSGANDYHGMLPQQMLRRSKLSPEK